MVSSTISKYILLNNKRRDAIHPFKFQRFHSRNSDRIPNRKYWKSRERFSPCAIECTHGYARSIAFPVDRGSVIDRGADASRAAAGDRDEEDGKDPLSGSLVVRDVNKARKVGGCGAVWLHLSSRKGGEREARIDEKKGEGQDGGGFS